MHVQVLQDAPLLAALAATCMLSPAILRQPAALINAQCLTSTTETAQYTSTPAPTLNSITNVQHPKLPPLPLPLWPHIAEPAMRVPM